MGVKMTGGPKKRSAFRDEASKFGALWGYISANLDQAMSFFFFFLKRKKQRKYMQKHTVL